MAKLLAYLIIAIAVVQMIEILVGNACKKQILGSRRTDGDKRIRDDADAKANDNFYDWWNYGPTKPEFYYDGSVKYNKVGGRIFPKGMYWKNANGEFADFRTAIVWAGQDNIQAPEE